MSIARVIHTAARAALIVALTLVSGIAPAHAFTISDQKFQRERTTYILTPSFNGSGNAWQTVGNGAFSDWGLLASCFRHPQVATPK